MTQKNTIKAKSQKLMMTQKRQIRIKAKIKKRQQERKQERKQERRPGRSSKENKDSKETKASKRILQKKFIDEQYWQ